MPERRGGQVDAKWKCSYFWGCVGVRLRGGREGVAEQSAVITAHPFRLSTNI